VKAALFIFALASGLSSGPAMAQPPAGCAACVSTAACNAQRDACVAECRARLFSIDPRRQSCIGNCSGKAAQCARAAAIACREKAQCQ
jgi:hypothetical protein